MNTPLQLPAPTTANQMQDQVTISASLPVTTAQKIQNEKPPEFEVDPDLGTIQALSSQEQTDYEVCEMVITDGWHTYVEVGLAFAKIRKLKLYRCEFDTFEDYCRVKWQYGRNYVNRLISAAQVFTHLVTNSLMPFGNSR